MATVWSAQELVAWYRALGFHIVTWTAVGAAKGPTEKGWITKALADAFVYQDGERVGVMVGCQTQPGRFLHDVDIDWGPGAGIVMALLPETPFRYGRASKPYSHGFYLLAEALPRLNFVDPIDKKTLLELRGTTENGEIGYQSMVSPSVWSDEKGHREQLQLVTPLDAPLFCADTQRFLHLLKLAAISLLLAKHLGHNGFGHDARMAWAGFLLRAGFTDADLETAGKVMSRHCNNLEVPDVAKVLETTKRLLEEAEREPAKKKKVKGGPTLAKLIGPHGKKIVNQILDWLGRDNDFVRNQDGNIVRNNQENIRRAIAQLDVNLSYNEFKEEEVIQEGSGPQQPFDDARYISLHLRIEQEFRFFSTEEYFRKVTSHFARENNFHPVRDYLNSLEWDGEDRINTWLTEYGGAVDEDAKSERDDSLTYLEAVSSIVLMAGVKRICEPGCKYDEMLVLENPTQGTNKSAALRALCPSDEWFSDDLPLNVDSQKVIERTLGIWLVEASDLAGKRKAEIEQLKAMLSRQVDGPARMAYARKPVRRPRHFVIIGTTNSSEYLPDSTGARRFWPVKVERFDVEGLVKVRDQLWAEAVVRVRAGESIRLPEKLWPVAAKHQERRREIDDWEDKCEAVVEAAKPNGDGKRCVTSNALYNAVGAF